MTARELEAHRLEVAVLDAADELRVRQIVHEALAVLDRNLRLTREHAALPPLVVRLAADAGTFAGVADVAGLREMFEHLPLRGVGPRLRDG